MMTVFRFLSITLSLICLFVGCQTENASPAKDAAPGPNQTITQTQRVKQTQPNPNRDHSSQAIADRLVKIATSVPHVKGATAVVLGKYTLVGIDLDPRLDRGRVGTVKYAVAQALQEDPQGAQALVTADVDLTQRIRDVLEDIKNGRPVAGILEELADITNRIVPQPSYETEKKEQAPTRQNEQRMKPTT
jgi:YhcN/YlaJ family sporulation lipoprotein